MYSAWSGRIIPQGLAKLAVVASIATAKEVALPPLPHAVSPGARGERLLPKALGKLLRDDLLRPSDGLTELFQLQGDLGWEEPCTTNEIVFRSHQIRAHLAHQRDELPEEALDVGCSKLPRAGGVGEVEHECSGLLFGAAHALDSLRESFEIQHPYAFRVQEAKRPHKELRVGVDLPGELGAEDVMPDLVPPLRGSSPRSEGVCDSLGESVLKPV